MNNSIKLSPRLTAAASFARRGSFVADVGTDHAYLPIYLCEQKLVRGAVASDVNLGPVERAKNHIRAYGLAKSISVEHCDGLDGLEKYSPDDIFILGMGGELIVSLLARAPWITTQGNPRRLVLQPMTHPETVRAYLLENSFSIVDEILVEDDKIYQIICAEYSQGGEKYPQNNVSLYFGAKNIERGGELLHSLLSHWVDILSVRIEGKKKGAGADTSFEEALLSEIETVLQKEKKQ